MKWIKCSERLPKHRERVSLTSNGKEIFSDVYLYGKDWERVNSLGWRVSVEVITHWMPFPEPPKEE